MSSELDEPVYLSDGDDSVVSENEDNLSVFLSEEESIDSGENVDTSERMEEFVLSKNGAIQWKKFAPNRQGRPSTNNIINVTPGPTRYAFSMIKDIKSSFMVFFGRNILLTIIKMSNKEGEAVYGKKWKIITEEEFLAYIGVLLLAGVYRSRNEATASLWNSHTGRAIFRATMSLERFHYISRIVRFDDKTSRPQRRQKDKLAAIREIWDKWVEILPVFYNPTENLTVDEQLVPFRGRCPFRQYIHNKPSFLIN